MAISKVPYVEIPGYTKEFCNNIQLNHKKILKIAQTQNASNEVAMIYNFHTGEKVFILGDEFHVDVESDINVKVLQNTSYAQELALCHNHPSTSNFSFADIDYFIANEYLALMSIVTNQGEVYILHKSSTYNYDKIREIEYALIEEHSLDVQKEIAIKFLKQCREGGVVYVKGK